MKMLYKMKDILWNVLMLVYLTDGLSKPSTKCTKITHSSCQSVAGYPNTAQFPDIDGKSYQAVKGSELNTYLLLLRSCSKVTSGPVLCSIYFPKCEEHLSRPILPCRSVCNDFVHKCRNELHQVAMQGMFAAMCDLLPLYDGSPDTCFVPDGFNVSQAVKGVNKSHCHKVGVPQCQDDLHYNTTFVSTDNQNKSDGHLLQAIINTKCSPNIEKYTCFTRIPPCTNGSVQIPCKSMCNEIKASCKSRFDSYGLPMNDCDFLYPDKQGVNGMCMLSHWPAPWPASWPAPWPASTPSPPTVPPTTPEVCSRCDKVKIQECADIGYTFHFKDIDGVSYQNHTADALRKFISLLTCSKYAKTILCSLYLPKCEVSKCSSKPLLPCRRVCYEFVRACNTELSLAAVHGLMVSLCDLLPWNSTDQTPCFYPDGFVPTMEVYQRDICHPISNDNNKCMKDFSYNTTFISPSDQTKAKTHLLQPIIDSKCSTQAEKLFCYTRLPPCGQKDHIYVPLPCRSMCNEVKEKCKDVFTSFDLPFADCNFLLPDGEGDGGICKTDKFPVPFRHFKYPPHPLPTRKPAGKKSPNAGLIAGLVVLLVVILAVVVTSIMCYRKKKHLVPFQHQELHNVSDTKNNQ